MKGSDQNDFNLFADRKCLSSILVVGAELLGFQEDISRLVKEKGNEK